MSTNFALLLLIVSLGAAIVFGIKLTLSQKKRLIKIILKYVSKNSTRPST